MAPKRKVSGTDAATRAAAILVKARKATAAAPASVTTPRRTSSGASDVKAETSEAPNLDRIPLNTLLSHLSSEGDIPMREALPIAGALLKAGYSTVNKLEDLSLVALEDMGLTGENAKKTVKAFRGARVAGMSGTPSKRRRLDVFQASSLKSTESESTAAVEYRFNEVLDEASLRGKYVIVNRAPVMTAWATVLLERMGFKRDEALSVAQCYVAHTSLARGVAIGEIPQSEADRAKQLVGANQPRFELMGVQIPVMQLQDGSWRGISAGDVVSPDKAFQYMRRSFNQTLPLAYGALVLLAESFLHPPPLNEAAEQDGRSNIGIKAEDQEDASALETRNTDGISSAHSEADEKKPTASNTPVATMPYGVDALHEVAYSLYTDFRPETSGQWGKKARFQVDKVLALRKGHEADWVEWIRRENARAVEPPEPPEEEIVDG